MKTNQPNYSLTLFYMKKVIALLFITFSILNGYGQTNWVTKKVGRENITANFPNEPKHDEKQQIQSEIYVSTVENCIFTILVKKNVAPNANIPCYETLNKLPISKQATIINTFLDKGIKQFIGNSSVNSPAKSIKVGQYFGKEIIYSNDYSGQTNKLFTKFLWVGNDLYIIQCTYQNVLDPCESLKDKFLNSVR